MPTGSLGVWSIPQRTSKKEATVCARPHHWSNVDDAGTFSRFLTKEVLNIDSFPRILTGPVGTTKASKGIDYNWQFIAFYALWRPGPTPDALETQVLLCFDLSDKIWEVVSTALKQIDLVSTKQDPFALHKVLAECVVSEFDRALWTFQPIIRDTEKVP